MLQVDYGLSASAAWQGLAVGLLVSVLFSVVPLLDVRQVKPSLLLRNDATRTGGIDWLKWGVAAGVGAALVGVAAWQAGSLRVGLLLSGGFVATAVVLHVCGVALVWAIQPLRYARSFALRQAVLHMVRPGNQTRVILLAVGLGAFFILGVRALQANLLRDFAVQAGPDAPGHVPHGHPAGPARPGRGRGRPGQRRPSGAAADPGAARARGGRRRARTWRSRTTSRCAGAAACRASSP